MDNTGNVNIGPSAVLTNNGIDFNTEGNYTEEDGEVLGINLSDHIIFNSKGYYSFLENDEI